MQTVVISRWHELTVYATDDEPPRESGVALVGTAVGERVRPALLRGPDTGWAFPYVALWPESARLPDPSSTAPAWTPADLTGVVLAEVCQGWRCRACEGRVVALRGESALPFFGDHLRHHRWATHCPNCGVHVDRARLHALLLTKHPASE
ncbi:hypothetical protein ACWY4P_22110 [Streptomyces sp. LZ34]